MKSIRSRLRASLLAIACALSVWALWLFAFGGFDSTVLGVRIRSNDPGRVLILALLALAGFLLAGGRIHLSPFLVQARRWAPIIGRSHAWIAVALAAVAVIVSTGASTRIAGGADAYGYISQADLWLAGSLKVPQPWVAEVPWPNSTWTFTPLGYRPAHRDGDWSIVPTYSPGLPLLMAAAKFAGGHCAMFGVVPLSLGLAVVATYGLGRRFGSPWAGVIAAWLVPTSPVVLEVSVESLTDVPAMAAWSLAFYFLLGGGVRYAAIAGASAALAILIRPNLTPLVIPMGLWFLIRRLPGAGARLRFLHAATFALGVLPGLVAVALINDYLYGSPFSSGYGSLGASFAWQHIVPNLRRFAAWIVETQTPLALLGIAALVVPLRRLWPGVADRSVFVVVVLYIALLWGQYSAYLEFDSPGYLRFLLPSWPFILIGLGSVLLAAARLNGLPVRLVVSALVVVLGVWNVRVAVRRSVFDQRQAARHEAPIGRLVQAHTVANSVVLAVHRSGSVRYYAGRTTLRYDALDPDWLDRAVVWMNEHGIRVYAMLDEREAAEVRSRFAGQRAVATLDHPVLIYQPAGTSLYDLTVSTESVRSPVVITEALDDLPGCDPPVQSAPLVLR